jgi:uncharacterized protein (DUF983 family)
LEETQLKPMHKGTKLYSALKFKCPHCHEDDFFEDRNILNLKKMGQEKDACDICHEKFHKEPGFYQGSYYVTHALGVAVMVTLWVAMSVLFPSASTKTLLGVVVGGLILVTPINYPLSKIIWANIFFQFRGRSSQIASD